MLSRLFIRFDPNLDNGINAPSFTLKGRFVKEQDTEDNIKSQEGKDQEDSQESEDVETEPASEESSEESREESREDFKTRYFYLAAEMENSRKRFEREKNNWIKYGNEKILTDLIEVVDNLERTLQAVEQEKDKKMKSVCQGIQMVHKQFLQLLKENGLTPVKALGGSFDPNFHEALSQKIVKGKKAGEIVEEYQKGYVLNGRLLRASKVIVAKQNNLEKEE